MTPNADRYPSTTAAIREALAWLASQAADNDAVREFEALVRDAAQQQERKP